MLTCPEGHHLAPDTAQWLPCSCASAERAGTAGHRTWRCPFCEQAGMRVVCYDPPHSWMVIPELAPRHAYARLV